MTNTLRLAQGGLAAWLFVLAAGCSHEVKPEPPSMPSTHVAYRTKLDAATPAYAEKDDNETYNTPVTIDNPPPQYPAQMISLHLAVVTVEAKAIVNEAGNVDEVRIALSASAPAYPPEFDAAVRDALMRWHYTPLRHTRWERVTDNEGNEIDARAVSVEAKPFSVDYEFRFELRDGKPMVDGGASAH